MRLGEIYEKQNAFDRAAVAYEAALASNPSLASTALKLAQLYSGPLHNGREGVLNSPKNPEIWRRWTLK